MLLVIVLSRVSKKKRDSLAAQFSEPGMRRTLAALLPLFVLAWFGLSQVMEARQREADKQLALKREAWQQAVERQRNIVEQAQKRINDSLEKGKEASKALGDPWFESHESCIASGRDCSIRSASAASAGSISVKTRCMKARHRKPVPGTVG